MVISCKYSMTAHPEDVPKYLPNWVNLNGMNLSYNSVLEITWKLCRDHFNVIIPDSKEIRRRLIEKGIPCIYLYTGNILKADLVLPNEESVDITKYKTVYGWLCHLMKKKPNEHTPVEASKNLYLYKDIDIK